MYKMKKILSVFAILAPTPHILCCCEVWMLPVCEVYVRSM